MKMSGWPMRMIAAAGACLLVAATIMSGAAAGCRMPGCGGCPAEESAPTLVAPAGACSMMAPDTPRLPRTEAPRALMAAAPLPAVVLELGSPELPVAFDEAAHRTALPAGPPGLLALRI